MKFSCSLFQVQLSQTSVEIMRRAVDSLVELLHTSLSESEQTKAGNPEAIRGGDSFKGKISFTDDLRTEDFKYIVNESSKMSYHRARYSLSYCIS